MDFIWAVVVVVIIFAFVQGTNGPLETHRSVVVVAADDRMEWKADECVGRVLQFCFN